MRCCVGLWLITKLPLQCNESKSWATGQCFLLQRQWHGKIDGTCWPKAARPRPRPRTRLQPRPRPQPRSRPIQRKKYLPPGDPGLQERPECGEKNVQPLRCFSAFSESSVHFLSETWFIHHIFSFLWFDVWIHSERMMFPIVGQDTDQWNLIQACL